MLHIPPEMVCRVCESVFCCSSCRRKHEFRAHANRLRRKQPNDKSITHIVCPICEQTPLVLREETMAAELLNHIEKKHLPLRCQKCEKVYASVDDIKEFTKCLRSKSDICQQTETEVSSTTCNEQCVDAAAATVPATSQATSNSNCSCKSNSNSIATQTTPTINTQAQTGHTPISVINMQWQAKNTLKHEFISNSDSVSSIKNASSSLDNSALKRSILLPPELKGTLVRSTSTPVHGELPLCKPKQEQHFHASAGHVSSIYNSVNDSNQQSPPINNINGTPNSNAVTALDGNAERYKKVVNRPKMIAVTPLRHVMSKSIQKAFAEQMAQVLPRMATREELPLDLRLSPVIRRSSKNLPVVLSAQRLTRESIVITHTKQLSSIEANAIMAANSSNQSNRSAATSSHGSIYETCSSVQEIITSSKMGQLSIQRKSYTSVQTLSEMKAVSEVAEITTPNTRLPGAAINKKLIKFETPAKSNESSPSEQYYTPRDMSSLAAANSSNRKESSEMLNPGMRRQLYGFNSNDKLDNRNVNKDSDLDDVFLPASSTAAEIAAATVTTTTATPVTEEVNEAAIVKSKTPIGTTSLWSLMSSVMQLPCKVNSHELPQVGKNFIKRCASIAGSLVRSKSTASDHEDEQQTSMKRKRTYTLDSILQPTVQGARTYADESYSANNSECKRCRIHGRKPIERMRKLR